MDELQKVIFDHLQGVEWVAFRFTDSDLAEMAEDLAVVVLTALSERGI